MPKYHISPETGRPNICRAELRSCPVGGEHFDNKQEARESYERVMDEATSALRGIQKERAAAREAKLMDLDGKDLSDLAGIEIVNRETGEVEGYTTFSKGELEMPGYLESVEKGYKGTQWETRRVNRTDDDDVRTRSEYCFVCKRATDHTGEHDELVDAGMAEYQNGMVSLTDTYDEKAARAVAAASYEAYDLSFQVVDASQDTPQVTALKADYETMRTSSAWRMHGDPMDEMIRHNLGVKMNEKEAEIKALQPEWDPKKEADLRAAQKKLAAAIANAKMQSNPDTAIQALPAYRLPEPGSKVTYNDAVVVKMQYEKAAPEGEAATVWNTRGNRAIIVPNLSTLTEKRKAAIADEIALLSGRNLEEWNRLSNYEKARSIASRVTRHKALDLEVAEDGKVSFGSRYSSSNGYDPEDVKLSYL